MLDSEDFNRRISPRNTNHRFFTTPILSIKATKSKREIKMSAIYCHVALVISTSLNIISTLLLVSLQGSMTSSRRRQSCWCPPGSRPCETSWTPGCSKKLPSTSSTTTRPPTPRTLSARITAACTRTPSFGTNPGLSEVSSV